MGLTFAITSAGILARRALPDGVIGEVSAVFVASFHVVTPAGVVCIGAAELGNGPLNALIEALPAGGWSQAGVAVGQRVTAANGHVQLTGGPSFNLATARDWQAAPWPAAGEPDQVRTALRRLADLAAPRVPKEGLASVAFGEPSLGGLTGQATRRALLATATLSDWLAGALDPAADPDDADALDEAARRAAHALLGLGPGLTPSGDDLLAGLVVALHATGESQTAARLADFIAQAPPDATTALSRAFLAAASEGLAGEAMAAMITALLTSDGASLPELLARIEAIGHTSGWDVLAGVVLGLAAVVERRHERVT
ncbi:MAG: DUF2877 domain-containing protein [Hyphomicrobiaceae bacterium]